MPEHEINKDRGEITRLLAAWGDGDEEAEEQLVAITYDHLRRLARGYLRKDPAKRFLQTTEIVHEAYLRLVDANVPYRDSNHFFVIAARTMRRILVDQARRMAAGKRQGLADELPLIESDLATETPAGLLDLDVALKSLGAIDRRKVQVIELRYFAGLTLAETAKILGISTATVERDLRMAKAWLTQAVAD